MAEIKYYSEEGLQNLKDELHHLIAVERPAAAAAIAEARDKGDLSENFEYHAAKREQSRLLGRISFKQKILANARVIDISQNSRTWLPTLDSSMSQKLMFLRFYSFQKLLSAILRTI